MLKLSRRIGERIMIGDDMSVRVLGVKGDQVRLGMSADKSVAIVRQEIYKKEEFNYKFILKNKLNITF